MLKRCGDNALEQSAAHANELALAGDDDGATTWRRIMAAVTQLANKTPLDPIHQWSNLMPIAGTRAAFDPLLATRPAVGFD
jgi:hypothetical protein